MIQNDTEKLPKSKFEGYCKICDFRCSKKGDLDRHLARPKHQNSVKGYEMVQLNAVKSAKSAAIFRCDCGNVYKHRSGLGRHQKTCEYAVPTVSQTTPISSNLIIELIKDNNEMKQIIIEQNKTITEFAKNGMMNNSYNTTTNSNNKTFNLHFFLNEMCKDAMNITDFVDSIKLQLSDLTNVGQIGYVDGISSIISTKLKELDVTKRPVHCTDKKRETLYVKDENKWEKEDDENTTVRKIIKQVADKNARLLATFKELHPDCGTSNSKYSDQYNKIIVESMGGHGDNDYEKETKIVKKLAKEVMIDKT